MSNISFILKSLPKLVKLPIAFIYPRKRSRWIFGSGFGLSHNTFLLYRYVTENYPEIDAIWCAKSKSEYLFLKKQKFKVCRKKSILTIYRGSVFIYDGGIRDVNSYAAQKAFKVNLWHGVGIKNIEFKIKVGPASKKFKLDANWCHRLRYLNQYTKPDMFLSTSPLMTEHFSECFRIPPNHCFEGFYPRCEVLLTNRKQLLKSIESSGKENMINLIHKLIIRKIVYIYMPTWRDSNPNFINEIGFDFEKVNKLMADKNGIFILKMHPSSPIDPDKLSIYENIICLDSSYDIYPLLPFTDVLITDYSSIYYDYLLMEDKSTILFTFDYANYVQDSRDFAYPYDKFTFGKQSQRVEDLFSRIIHDDVVPNNCAGAKKVADLFWANKGSSCADIIHTIKDRLSNK